jgi:hypothetical protein
LLRYVGGWATALGWPSSTPSLKLAKSECSAASAHAPVDIKSVYGGSCSYKDAGSRLRTPGAGGPVLRQRQQVISEDVLRAAAPRSAKRPPDMRMGFGGSVGGPEEAAEEGLYIIRLAAGSEK